MTETGCDAPTAATDTNNEYEAFSKWQAGVQAMMVRLRKWFVVSFIGVMAAIGFAQCGLTQEQPSTKSEEPKTMQAMFGGGCFWCVEAVFEQLKGVQAVESGFAGGQVDSPSYKQVCGGDTGHAEVVHITYDPNQCAYEKLLEVFFKTHDPTTLNQQGPDYGTQYRSVIFYFDDEQRMAAEKIKKALDESGAFAKPIVTEIVPAATFFPAEDYHQDYFRKNPDASYCQFAIRPKLDKFKKVFADSLKDGAK